MQTETSQQMLHDHQPSLGPGEVYDDGCLRVEFDHYFVTCKGHYVELTRTEFLLICRLTRSINRIVKAQDLWEYARPSAKPFNLRSLHVHLFKLRHKLEPFGLRITNLINVGYGLSHGACCQTASEEDELQSTAQAGLRP